MPNYSFYGPGDRLVGIKTQVNGKDAFLPVSVSVTSDGAEAIAQNLQGQQTYTEPMGYQRLSSQDLATAKSLTVPAGAARAVIQNNGAQAARFRNDGTAPTASIGQRLTGGDAMDVTGSLGSYQFIREAEGAQLDVNYYG